MTHAMSATWLTKDVLRVHISRNPNGTHDVFLKNLRGQVIHNGFIRRPRRVRKA